jgi:hypothetical protein
MKKWNKITKSCVACFNKTTKGTTRVSSTRTNSIKQNLKFAGLFLRMMTPTISEQWHVWYNIYNVIKIKHNGMEWKKTYMSLLINYVFIFN